MSKLSPAAEAVFDAYANALCRKPRETWLASALPAAVDKAPAPDHHEEDAFHAGFWAAIEYVQSIADELEAL